MSDAPRTINNPLAEKFKDLIPPPEKLPRVPKEPDAVVEPRAEKSNRVRAKTQSEKKKHTFNLNERAYQDFFLFVKGIGRTVEDYINEFLAVTVEQNSDLIKQLKKHRH